MTCEAPILMSFWAPFCRRTYRLSQSWANDQQGFSCSPRLTTDARALRLLSCSGRSASQRRSTADSAESGAREAGWRSASVVRKILWSHWPAECGRSRPLEKHNPHWPGKAVRSCSTSPRWRALALPSPFNLAPPRQRLSPLHPSPSLGPASLPSLVRTPTSPSSRPLSTVSAAVVRLAKNHQHRSTRYTASLVLHAPRPNPSRPAR